MNDRTPPQDLAAERAVLGAAMSGSRQLADAADLLQPRDFYRPAHETIWQAILALDAQGQPVDMVAVAGKLGTELQRVGGHVELAELVSIETAPNPAQLLYYAEQVLDKALRRRLVDASYGVQQLALEADDAMQAAQDARQLVDSAAADASTAEGGVAVGDAIDAAIDWLEHEQHGADTPWSDVNARTNGLLPGQMITVAARPGHGKSLALKDTALFTAMQGRAVHVATLEMSRDEYIARILSSLSRVDLGKMLRRQMSDDEWAKVGRAADKLRGLPLYLDDREQQSMAQIRAAARQTARRFGVPLGLIGIDYCQLVKPAQRLKVREQEVAQISRDTKLMAKEFQCPVMLLAQLNRGNVSRTDPTPMVSDLRESGALEQDSDQVWLLHRPDQYGEEYLERTGEVDLIVGKNRNGYAPTTVPLAFRGHYGHIGNLA